MQFSTDNLQTLTDNLKMQSTHLQPQSDNLQLSTDYLQTLPYNLQTLTDNLKMQSTHLQLQSDNLQTLPTYLRVVDNRNKINNLRHFYATYRQTNTNQQCSHIAKAKTENQPLQRGCKCKTSTVEFLLSNAIERLSRKHSS